jgi:arylsulfatase
MNRRPLRYPSVAACAAACLLSLLALAGCHKKQPLGKPWVHLDLTKERPIVEATPPGVNEDQVYSQRIAQLGAAEVRDMSKVPPAQQQQFPKSSPGEIRVVEQTALSRIKWRVHIDDGSYVSFIPLGFEKPCACKFRFGIRAPEGVIVLYEAEAKPLSPTAPKAVEIDLSGYADKDVDLLFQVDGPPAAAPGQVPPSLLWGSPALYSRQPQPSAYKPSRPSILLVGIDTLRADRLGPWGRRPSLTPSIDRLAEESDVWTQAFSTFNATNPSFASIMTGLYGKNHGVYDLHTRLPAGFTTLASRLAGAGYQTMAIIAARHLGDHNSGLGQGFAEVTRADEHFAAELGVDQTLDWIAVHCTRPQPFFVWLHLFDPHTPHTPPDPYADGLRPAGPMGLGPVRAWVPFREPGPRSFDEPVLGGNRDLYDGEVAYLDRQLGRLLDGIASRGLLDSTLVVLVADHGENLGEHGLLYRHVGLFDTTTHVPLLVRWPGPARPGRRFDGLAQTIDLFPTLLAAAGLPVPPQDGIDLRRLSPVSRVAAADTASGSDPGAPRLAAARADAMSARLAAAALVPAALLPAALVRGTAPLPAAALPAAQLPAAPLPAALVRGTAPLPAAALPAAQLPAAPLPAAAANGAAAPTSPYATAAVPALAGPGGRRAVFAEHSNGFGAMVRTRDYQYIFNRGNTAVFPDGPALYDLRADPYETRNLAGQGLAAERELAGLLNGWLAQRRPRPGSAAEQARPHPLSEQEAARLRSLGYVREIEPQ